MSLFVLVLAGGEGRRMGGGKPARLLGGERLIDRAVRLARQWSNDPVVALREGRDNGRPDARVVCDRPGVEGPLAGLAAGVTLAIEEGADRLLLIPADMPFLPDDLAAGLGTALDASDVGCAMASSGGRRHPVCSLWALDRLGVALPAYCAEGRRSLKGLAEMVGTVAVDWDVAEARDPFFNVNDPDDLSAAEAMLD